MAVGSPGGVNPMNSVRHIFLIAAAIFALMLWPASQALTQSRDPVDLTKKFFELYRTGKIAEALPLAEEVLTISEKAFGPDHPDVAAALSNLAFLYDNQGRYAEAEPLYKRALAIREKAFEPEHPNVAKALNNLAELYRNQGRYAESEPLHKRSLAIREKAFGPDHSDVAQSLNNLAVLYDNQGRYAEAEPLYKRALAIREKAFGPEHPDVARSLNGLAVLYDHQGRYAEAETLSMRALAIREKAFGPEHPDVAAALNSLAVLYDHQHRFAEAEPLSNRALAIWERLLGSDHPIVAAALTNLAALYDNQGRYAESEPLHKRSLAIREAALGPDHPDVAQSLSNLAFLYDNQGRYADAEPLYKRALAISEKAFGLENPNLVTALNNLAEIYYGQSRYAEAEPLLKRALGIHKKAFGADHPSVARLQNNLAALYGAQGRFSEALPLIQMMISNKTAEIETALPTLLGAQFANLIAANEAIDDGLNVVQARSQSSAGAALNALAIRFSAGNDRLAQLVRQDQDLTSEGANLNKAIVGAVASDPTRRDAAAEQRIKDRIAAVAKERDQVQVVLRHEFADFASLSNPQPLTIKDIQELLAYDEALIVVDLGARSYVWAITRSAVDWKELSVNASQAAKSVATLRSRLNVESLRLFDPELSFELYQQVLGPVEDMIASKVRLSLVVNGALSSLPPQVLVTRDPAGKALKDVDWLVRTHAITVLPSVASLRVLRGKSALADAKKPLIGFANAVFNPDLQQNVRVAAEITASRGIRGTVADVAELKTALPPLPETADELREVAASVKADPTDVILGPDATETRVKREKLDQYRIVYFATHGLLAGDVADFAKLNAEPALVLSLPEQPTEFDDGLLTASEVAQLKLNADWVVLSACNTASAEKPGAEALSGLARAFFYAGARSLIVSNWEVESQSAVALMVRTFTALAANPKLSHGEALQQSMVAMIGDSQHPAWADPKFWAPFVVVGEPAKPTHK
jgi:CHAT domain-containing protein/Flp pilus assembly protein TadD